MFESIRKHTKLMMVLLFLVTIPAFVLVGVDGFKSIESDGPAVAFIGRQKITQMQWERTHKQETERIQAQQPQLDPRLLDTPVAKYATLERLVRDNVIGQVAQDAHLTTSDARLANELMRIPGVRKSDGTIDRDAYNRYLQRLGYARAEDFEAQLRRDLSLQLIDSGVVQTAIESKVLTSSAMDALFQRREVQIARFVPSSYSGKVKIEQSDIDAYYQSHQDSFKQQESADIEYLVLDLDTVKKSVSVPEGDVKTYYEQNVARLSGKEERRASHILVAASKDASSEQRKAAKDKALNLLAQARKSPQNFADLARKNSDDTNSAKAGGDLDYFARGAMVKPFEEAVFSMKKGELSDVVESDFGYHIILVTDVKSPKTKTLEELRPGIEADLRAQLAQSKYAEYAQTFTDGVFEQPDSLKGVAEKLKIEIKKARLVRDTSAALNKGVLSNPKLVDAVFSAETLANKLNTNALELGGNTLVSARVVHHYPAQVLPLAEVQDQVRLQLQAKRSAELASQDGQAKLLEWKAASAGAAALGAPILVSREQPQNLEQTLLADVLRADVSKLPAWVGVDLGDRGYAVVRVNSVKTRPETSEEAAQRERARVALWTAKAEADAYFELLKRQRKVEMKAAKPAAQ